MPRLTLLQRIKRKIGLNRYENIRRLTHGMLAHTVYERIYQCACEAEPGWMIDIGPAQGGSSISLGLGIRESGKNDTHIYSIEKCIGSGALASKDDKNANLQTLQNNIARYGLSDLVTILPDDPAVVYDQIPDGDISLMFIDADGALDRDFQLFYNRIKPGSPIILDDCIDMINHFARERYLQFKSEQEINEYVKNSGKPSFLKCVPLGKEYTTYRFVKYLLDAGLLEQDCMLGQTFFGRKRDATFTEKHDSDMQQIRAEILAKYYEMNPHFQA